MELKTPTRAHRKSQDFDCIFVWETSSVEPQDKKQKLSKPVLLWLQESDDGFSTLISPFTRASFLISMNSITPFFGNTVEKLI